ncbi:MAG: MlaD family protein [Eudoraea sp.]|uniref:MlaD family protein n=1 Tax=Eudoraea sp. TaxID=1979955 RepID=UPI003C770ECE
MEKTSLEKLRLGIFVIMGTVLLVIGAYVIGNRQNMFGNTFTIHAIFKNVNGLQEGNNVRYSGIGVGTVKDIVMENDSTIDVVMIIQDKMLAHIKKDAIATIGSDGLVGSMIINIVPGDGSGSKIESGDQIVSYSRIGAEDMMSTLNVTSENAALLTADLLKVTAALTKGKGTLGRLLNDTLMAKNLEQTILNLKLVSAGANKTLEEVNSFVKEANSENSVVGVLLRDSLAGLEIKQIIHSLESASDRMQNLTVNLDSVVSGISEGKGTLNYLANDTILVQRLEATMINIEEGTARFNENMEALKHNFLTRGYFKKMAKEEQKKAKKEQKNN